MRECWRLTARYWKNSDLVRLFVTAFYFTARIEKMAKTKKQESGGQAGKEKKAFVKGVRTDDEAG